MVITGTAVRSSAGRLEELFELLLQGGHAIAEQPPYASEGLAQPRCAVIRGLDRQRPAEVLLREVVQQVVSDPARTGLVVGTSSGNISGPWEAWHRAVLAGQEASEEGTWRQSPTERVAAELGLARHTTVSVACASGTAAFVVADGWLREDEGLDQVVVAGVDALSLYIHAGFSGLGALTASLPRPFSADRDGLVLGEGAAALVLSREGEGPTLLGVGMSGDAVHMTAPDRTGRGCARGMRAALDDAGLGPEDIDMVSVHGTGTVFNDNMEAHALASLFPRGVPIFGVKQAIGHTLGAAGAIEAAIAVEAWKRGVQLPAPPELAPDLPLRLVPGGAPARVLSTNSAFGGANAALVFGSGPAPERLPRQPTLVRTALLELAPGKVDWSSLWSDSPERFKRMNRYVRAGLVATHRLLGTQAQDPDTGIVLASESNCRHVDLRYHTKLVRRGAAGAPRVDFIYTIPGAPVGEVSIQWKLRGPQLSLCAPMEQADEEACRLIRWGRAERMVALGIEAPDGESPARVRAALWAVNEA